MCRRKRRSVDVPYSGANSYCEDGWIRGSSPRMTIRMGWRRALASEGDCRLVFSALQNPRHHAAADQFPDRRRARRRASCWPRDWRGSAAGCWSPRSCCWRYADFRRSETGCSIRWNRDFRLGCRARRAGRHCRARRIDRCGSFGRAWRGRRPRRGRPHHRGGGAGPSLSERPHHLYRRQRQSDFGRRPGSRLRRRHFRTSRHRPRRG